MVQKRGFFLEREPRDQIRDPLIHRLAGVEDICANLIPYCFYDFN
jgi:hypothetical protein